MNDDVRLRIAEIHVSGLFGIFNHSISLNLDDRITIIHGPNGVGKTALLRLVDAFATGKFLQLTRVPFDSFALVLSDRTTVGIRRTGFPATETEGATSTGPKELAKSDAKFLLFACREGAVEKTKEVSAKSGDANRLMRVLDSEIPWLTQIGPDEWVDRRSETVYSTEQALVAFSDQLPERYKKNLFAEPDWLAEIRRNIHVHLVETQRLLRISAIDPREYLRYSARSGGRVTSTVRNYAKDLQAQIAETLAEYAKQSQSLDQSFPQRLLSGTMKALETRDLKQRMEGLEQKRGQLKRIGLLDEDTAYPFDITSLDRLDPTQRAVMTLYADDTARKLGVLDELSNRILVLLNNVNKKFRYKTVSIDKKRGLIANGVDGHDLDLDVLSSGEQHELVLIYELLFRVRPNTLVMIDEPELSLHINWQKAFLSDLTQIVRTVGFDVLLATHSPFIAGDRTDLMIPLASDRD